MNRRVGSFIFYQITEKVPVEGDDYSLLKFSFCTTKIMPALPSFLKSIIMHKIDVPIFLKASILKHYKNTH